jgi:NAD(P)-dependent dehydrogenase (short-subunit alcohol dehydrogenase family)
VVVGRNLERGAGVVDAIRTAGGQADFLAADLVDGSSARDLAHRALDLVGAQIDILVSNAAAGAFGATEQFDEADFDRVVGTNLKAPFYLVGALAPRMVEHGRGAIVCVSSMGGQMGIAGLGVYGGTKAGMDLITRSWAAEYGPHGVRVNTVSPGLTATPSAMADPGLMERASEQILLGHAAQPEQVAAAIVFLASDAADHINGVVLNVDGGRRM